MYPFSLLRSCDTVVSLKTLDWPAWHWVPVVRDVEVLSEVVGSTDQRQLDEEMVEEQHFEASPLLLPGLWFVLHTHTHRRRVTSPEKFLKVWQTESTTNLLDLESLHERHKLEEEAGQAEQEVDELVDNQRPPGGDLELGVVVQHVAPGMLQWGLEGVLRQHGVHVLHRQVGWAQDVCRTVHLHDGRPGMSEKKTVSSEQPDRRCLLDWLYNQAPNWILFWLYG